jgi:hypothetical protein
MPVTTVTKQRFDSAINCVSLADAENRKYDDFSLVVTEAEQRIATCHVGDFDEALPNREFRGEEKLLPSIMWLTSTVRW